MTNETAAPANSSCSSEMKSSNANADSLGIEIKKTWNRLSDDEIKLHADQPELFFAAVKTKYGTDKEEAQKRLTEIKASCGACTTEKAA